MYLVEGPACALSLAMCGFPTLAVGGCTLPHFLALQCGLREVAIASDCDEAGDKAALDWKWQLEQPGARSRRIRADEVAEVPKDWNEALQAVGEKRLRQFLFVQSANPQAGQGGTQSEEIRFLNQLLEARETANSHY